MLNWIGARNFKSIGELQLVLGKFNCLIGMNGAGKSTVLQCIDFISQLMTGKLDDWLQMRDWGRAEIANKISPNSTIQVATAFQCSNNDRVVWNGYFSRTNLVCTREAVKINREVVFEFAANRYRFDGRSAWQDVEFLFQGSILSQMRDERLPPGILEMREGLRRIRSLELLAPHLMRRRARMSDDDIGAGGEKLSAYLHSIRGDKRDRLAKLLKEFYPNLEDFKITSQKAGWKKLSIFEQFKDHRIETEARHINDGLLRVLAIIAQAESDRSLILLDEIENGINPEIVAKLVDVLVASPQQMLVTTHSPMILNYLTDEVARNSVQLVYKNPQGYTRVRPFFSLQRISGKLDSMGPGEAFVDTDLAALAREFVTMDERERESKELSQKGVAVA